MNFKHYLTGRTSTRFSKWTYKIRTFHAQPKITGSYEKVSNTVIAKVVIIQI